MLQSIHDKAKGILGIIIVIFIGLVFALWGIGDYLTGATEKFAAKVDDIQISQSEFEQGLARQRQRMEEMFQGEIPDSPIFEQQIKSQVLEQLINQRVLQKMVDEYGYRVADPVLVQKIKNMDAFKQDGVFVAEAYEATVQSQGMGIREFENLFRNDLAIQQLQDAVLQSAVISSGELNILNRIQQQSRDISYLEFENKQFIADIKVSDDEIVEYFNQNQSRYMHPETVSISYVELKGDDLAEDIPVDEEAVRRLYDDYVASLQSKEMRKASHILIALSTDASEETQQQKEEAINSVLDRINDGEEFAAVAKEVSEDPGSSTKGGDLGWVNKGMMVPAFETALFKLSKGQVSDVVKSSFGYHIIKLEDIKVDDAASFESKLNELTQQYKLQLLEDRFYEQSELMATTAYENDQSLQEVADALGLQIKTADAFTRTQGKGISAIDKVRKAAFDSAVLSEGRNSDIIEIAKNHAMVLRVDVHTESKPKTLDEVKPQVIASLKSEKARTGSQEAALAALAKLESGLSIDSSDVKGSARLSKPGLVKRDEQSVNPVIVREAFLMKKPVNDKPVYKVAELATGTAVIQLNKVALPEKATAEQLNVLARQFQNQQATRDMEVVISHLKSQSDIVRADGL